MEKGGGTHATGERGTKEEAEGAHQWEGVHTRWGLKWRVHRNRGCVCPHSVNMWKGGDMRTTGGGCTFGRGHYNEGVAIAHPCLHAPFACKGGCRQCMQK